MKPVPEEAQPLMARLEFDSVYLARHGQTVWNTEGRRQGRPDSQLTPEGVLQVRRNAALAQCGAVDAICTSPMGRARSSAAILVSHEMIGRMLLKNLAGLDREQALRLSHPSGMMYVVRPSSGTIESLSPGGTTPPNLMP
jgi:broad specificity phosphatase PhoE